MGKCDNCSKEAELKCCVINDEMGTRYRNLCTDCASKLASGEKTTVNEKYKTVNRYSAVHSSSHSESKIYKVISILIAIGGAILGVILGIIHPAYEISYLYSEKVFNVLLMLYIWGATAFLVLLTSAIYFHLRNQEETLNLLNGIVDKTETETEYHWGECLWHGDDN